MSEYDDEELAMAVFDLIGQSSMLWTERPTGVFKSEAAQELGDSFILWLSTRHGLFDD